MIIKQSFYYPPADADRPLHIYLPDDYDRSDEKYPVMYFFDGHNLFSDEDATYGKSWGMKEFLDGWSKKIIIVGMECAHTGHDRLSEYMPIRAARGWMSKCENPLGDATIRWIINDVKPYIDRTYRTWSHREATGIGGSSMGGLMSLYAIEHYNSVFSKGACVSSSISACYPELMNDMSAADIHPDTRAWLSWGTKEAGADNDTIDCKSYSYRCNRAAANKLLKNNALPQLYCQLGGGHCEADWEKQVPMFMQYLWLDD